MRFFNTAGPVDVVRHYCIPPLERIDLDDMLMLIDQQKYVVLHAPRQTGKTSCMLALMAYLNRQAQYHCVYCNVEAAQGARENVYRGIRVMLNEIAERADLFLDDGYLQQHWPQILERTGEDGALNQCLTQWAKHHAKPIVLIIDEIDSLIGDTLISVLRQLRSGYDKRPQAFPQSIILCGVRDVRDYRIHSSRQKEIITGGSAFNITAKSMRVGDFVEKEVDALLYQHTQETEQVFARDAQQAVWRLTQGQPWLVNALAYETCFENRTGRNRHHPITVGMIRQAAENIILRRESHLDQLADKLQEQRVRQVIEPIISGQDMKQIPADDVQYCLDLGLIKRKPEGIVIANPIYREVLPRELSFMLQLNIEPKVKSVWYVDADGRLNMEKMLTSFQSFFREHSEAWLERFDYKEAGPQLLMQAFLQRVVNSGGRVEREYGLGTRRTDLLVIWPILPEEVQRDLSRTGILPDWPLQKIVIELKVRRKQSLETIQSKGLEQTLAYMDRCAADEAHLVIFDQRPDVTWEQKVFANPVEYHGKQIKVWGM